MNNDDEVELRVCCGFTVLPVRLLGGEDTLANTEDDDSDKASKRRFHDILFKQLEPSDTLPSGLKRVREAAPSERTVWMINVPIHYDADALEELVAAAGPLERTEICDYEPMAGRTSARMRMALLVFRKAASMRACLAMRVARVFQTAVDAERAADGPAGREAEFWVERPNERLWQVELDATVQEYDARRAAELLHREEQAATVDADGFTIVRRTKKGLQKSGGANVRAYTARPGVAAPKKKKRLLKDFYAFQINQRRDNELESLKRKFEEDRERLKRIRANRVFNPK
jgi:uncharacterized protein (DUF2384 family)